MWAYTHNINTFEEILYKNILNIYNFSKKSYFILITISQI